MTPPRITEAAGLIASARREGRVLPGLPESCRPGTVAEAEAIQRATFEALGLTVGGWKLARGPEGVPISCPMPAEAIWRGGDLVIPLPEATLLEFELALRFARDMEPADLARLTPEQMPEVADLVPLFEFVVNRYAEDAIAGPLDRAAECLGNFGAQIGDPTGPWDWSLVERPSVRLTFAGREVARFEGAHRAAPFAPLMSAWRDRCVAEGRGVCAGETVTLGSLTGMLPIPAAGEEIVGEVIGRGSLRCVVARVG